MDPDRDGNRDRPLLVEFALGKLSPEESRRILDAVDKDPDLSADLEHILLMLNEGEREGLLQRQKYGHGGESGTRLREWSRFARHAIRTAAVLCMILGAGLIIREVSKPPFCEIATVGDPDLEFRSRGGSEDILAAARGLLLDGTPDDALHLTGWYLAVYPEGSARAEAHLLRATAFLLEAKKTRVGIVVTFDSGLVEQAWRELQLAKTDGWSPGIAEHILWFESKALLMKGHAHEARLRLQQVVALGGVRSRSAAALLDRFHAPVNK